MVDTTILDINMINNLTSWIKWYFYDTKICHHTQTYWQFIDYGMGKAIRCRNCDKCLKII